MSILKQILTNKAQEIRNQPEVDISNCPVAVDFGNIFTNNSQRSIKLIAEIKQKSPSGLIKTDNSAENIAQEYIKSRVDGISVLTDSKFFAGSFENLQCVRGKSAEIPILCKDFIISRKQLDCAKFYGASGVLLIVKCLDLASLIDLKNYAKSLQMQALIEVSTENELEIALGVNPENIGVNCRNLDNLEIDRSIFTRILPKIPSGVRKIALSGVQNCEDLKLVNGYDAVLIGTALSSLKLDEISRKIGEFDTFLCS